MKRGFVLFFCAFFISGCGLPHRKDGIVPRPSDDVAEYMRARQELSQAELAMRIGAGIELTPAEKEADRRLMSLKHDEIERTRKNFPLAQSFLRSETRRLIDQSPILEIMKHMPKGGILHGHGLAMGDYHWLVKHATYRPDCYIFQGPEDSRRNGALRISPEPPGDGWRAVSELRQAADDVGEFDEGLYRSITLGEEDLSRPDIWVEFGNCLIRSGGLIRNEIYEDFCRKLLRDLIAENVQYIETRSGLANEEIIEEVRRDHPEFRVKYIFSSPRSASRESLAERLGRALDMRAEDPASMIGFDLVEEEDATHTNLYFLNELLAAGREAGRRGIMLPFYLHSGESNWTENENVLDAILLGSKRIGHGLTLFKHPLLMERVKERDIAIEVCPMSNQVLGYVPDLRNHPAVLYIASGLPVVICPDDPGIWKATFSYDYYAAFMAWGLDLKCLKQLAMNSLLYSAMEPEEKERALRYWREEWTKFIAWLNRYRLLASPGMPSAVASEAEFLLELGLDLGRGLRVETLASGRTLGFAGRSVPLSDHDELGRRNLRAVGPAVVPDVVVVRDHGDIRFPSLVVPDELDELVVSAMRGEGKEAADPGDALLTAAGKLEFAVEDDNGFDVRMLVTPGRDLEGEAVPGVLEPAVEARPELRNPVDDVVAVDEEDHRPARPSRERRIAAAISRRVKGFITSSRIPRPAADLSSMRSL